MPRAIRQLLGHRPRAAARRAARAGDWQAAAATYGLLIRRGLADARDHVQRGHALKEVGNTAGAEAAYRAGVVAFPLDADARRQLALFLRQDGDPNEAADVMACARILAPDAAGADTHRPAAVLRGGGIAPAFPGPLAYARAAWHAAAAALHLRAGHWRAASHHLRRSLAVDPRRPERLARLATTLSAGGEGAAAADAARLALLHRPRDPELHVTLGTVLQAAGCGAAAEQAMLLACRLHPGHPRATAALYAAGWSEGRLASVIARGWQPAAAALEGLDPRERAIWAHLAYATGGA